MHLKHMNRRVGLFLIGYHLALFIGLPFYFVYAHPSVGLFITSLVLFYLAGLSVTLAYHRYYAHRTYTTNRIVEAVLLFFSSMALEGSALQWAYEHRLHHRFTDTMKDPYSIKKGFWYAHVLWLFEPTRPIDPTVVPDLMQNRLVQFQYRYYGWFALISNALAFLFVGWLFHDFLGALVIATGLRMFALHHITWFINSLAHTAGRRPYSGLQSAADNHLVALLTFGEGYHNYHHTFPSDYRNGVKWYHIDPTKWMLWILRSLYLVSDFKKTSFFIQKKFLILEQKRRLLATLQKRASRQQQVFLKRIDELSVEITERLAQLHRLLQTYRETKKERNVALRASLRHQITLLREELHYSYRAWRSLHRQIRTVTH